MVELAAVNRRAVGSSPSSPAIKERKIMSTYLYFYLRPSITNYIQLTRVSRYNRIYDYTSPFAKYEEVTPLSQDRIEDIIQTIGQDIKAVEETIRDKERINQNILVMNNSVDEKLNALAAEKEALDYLKQDLIELSFAQDFFITLNDIYNYNKREEPWIYIGIETPIYTLE